MKNLPNQFPLLLIFHVSFFYEIMRHLEKDYDLFLPD